MESALENNYTLRALTGVCRGEGDSLKVICRNQKRIEEPNIKKLRVMPFFSPVDSGSDDAPLDECNDSDYHHCGRF